VVTPFEKLCPVLPEQDMKGTNDEYVDVDFGCQPTPNSDCELAYRRANLAEEALCNAHEHYQHATSFDNRFSWLVPTQEERLTSLRSSLYFLRRAVQFIGVGFRSGPLTAANESYQRYLAAQLAESAALADSFAMDGADLATGISDSLGRTYGSFTERQRQVWGQLAADGTLANPGKRGAAYSFLYGLPWKNLDDQLVKSPEDWPATLPLCEVDATRGAVARAVRLLMQVGVPVTVTQERYMLGPEFTETTERRVTPWIRPGDAGYGRRCLEHGYTGDSPGVPVVSFEEILATHDINEAALQKASQALVERSRVSLIDMSLESKDGCDYLVGFSGISEDLQAMALRARVGLYRVNKALGNGDSEGLDMQRAGLESIYAELFAITDCLLGGGSADYSCIVQSRALRNDRPGDYLSHDTRTIVGRAYDTLVGQVGERYIDFEQSFWKGESQYSEDSYWLSHRYNWGTNIAETTPNVAEPMALGIYFHNFDPDNLDRVRVFAVDAERNPLRGVENEYYDLLSCLRYGHSVVGGSCDLTQWETHYGEPVCQLGRFWRWGDNACFVYLPHYRELGEECSWQMVCSEPRGWPCYRDLVCYTQKEHIPPKLFVVTLHHAASNPDEIDRYEVIDTYLEKRPDDVDDHLAISWHRLRIYTRHFVDERYLARKARRITERDPRSCSLPQYNSLGLPNDMPVPLENELISALQPGGAYEDSFAFFLAKAKAAAEAAGQAVAAALSAATDLGAAEQHATNLRQDALDRIEQICGVGSQGCTTEKRDYRLEELGVLPEASAPPMCPRVDIEALLATDDAHEMAVTMEDSLRCQAETLFANLGEVWIRGLPLFIGNALQNGNSSTLSYNQYDGQYKVALLDVDTGITNLRSAAAQARHELDNLGTDIGSFEAEAGALDAEETALLLDALASAFQAMAEIGKCGPGNYGCGFAAASAVVRALASAMRAQAAALRKLAHKFSFVGQMTDKAYSIEQSMLLVEKSLNTIQAGIERLELLELEQTQSQNRAERMADEYLAQYLGSETSGQMKAFRMMTLRSHLRARREIKRAKVMSFIARRAVEMKLAVDLNREKQPGVIGAPPSEWAGDLFTMYVTDDIYNPGSPQNTASDYVTRLEDYVYGYPFQYPFADGADLAIMSLRDDLSSYTESCFEAIGETNLLPFSSRLEDWEVVDSDGGTVAVLPNTSYGPGDVMEPTADTLQVQVSGCSEPERCMVLESRKTTSTDPQPSSYVGSIYLRGDNAPPLRLTLVASFRDLADHTVIQTEQTSASCAVSSDWQRCSVEHPALLSPPADQYLELSLRLSPIYGGSGITDQFELEAWGAQLEICEGLIGDESNQGECVLSPYERTPVPTGVCSTATVTDPYTGLPRVEHFVSPQARSEELRASFRVKCVQDDFAKEGQVPAACAGKGGVDYFERPFSITLNSIEAGDILGQGQIGQGNYNYRVESVAVNLVGSNVKDCSLDPGAGTSCYTNLFIPYDLVQDGKVRLRDHSGHELPFRLAVGTIHQGKAIAAERLLTNPLSSTDQSLVQQYLKHEFRGRPIQGNFTLRIYGTPSLRWTNLEDVQIYLNYRYWSPFANP